MDFSLLQRRGDDDAFAATVVCDPRALLDAGATPPPPDAAAAEPADAPAPQSPLTIGRYALKRALGKGGFGAVHEAWDPLLSRMVAVKTLHVGADDATRAALDPLLLDEARAAAGLSHPHIVTVFDAGMSAQGVYIAMERLRGRDLRQALHDGWRPSPAEAALLVRRVADALAYAHARGVVHCDIKPANIFLVRHDRPKVLDFGIARVTHRRTAPAFDQLVAGSPHHLAPEQLAGGEIDARTDLYALGTVLYELLTGAHAFDGATLAEITQAVASGSVLPADQRCPQVPPALAAIAQRAIARDPADRYPDAAAMSHALRGWLVATAARESASAAPDSAPASTPPTGDAAGEAADGSALQQGSAAPATDAAVAAAAAAAAAARRASAAAATPAAATTATATTATATTAAATPAAPASAAAAAAAATMPPAPASANAAAAAGTAAADAGAAVITPTATGDAAAATPPDAGACTAPPAATKLEAAGTSAVPARRARRGAVIALGLIVVAASAWFATGADDGEPARAEPTSSAVAPPPLAPAALPTADPVVSASDAAEAAIAAAAADFADLVGAGAAAGAAVAADAGSPTSTAAAAPEPAKRPVAAQRRGKKPVAAAPPPLPPAAPALGVLQFAVSPWGAVEVDGAAVGVVPPLTRLELPAGAHTVTIRNEDFPPHVQRVQVDPDRPVVIRHRFGS